MTFRAFLSAPAPARFHPLATVAIRAAPPPQPMIQSLIYWYSSTAGSRLLVITATSSYVDASCS